MMDYGGASENKGNMFTIYTHSFSRGEKSQYVFTIGHFNSFRC